MNVKEANFHDLVTTYYYETEAFTAASILLEAINYSNDSWLSRMLLRQIEITANDKAEIKFHDALDDLIDFYNILEISLTGGLISAPDINSIFWKNTKVILENYYVKRYYTLLNQDHLSKLLLFRIQLKLFTEENEKPPYSLLLSFFEIEKKFIRNHRNRSLLKMLNNFTICGYTFDDVITVIEAPDKFVNSLLKNPDDREFIDEIIHEFDLFMDFCFRLDEILKQAHSWPLLQSELWYRYTCCFDLNGRNIKYNLENALNKFLSWKHNIKSQNIIEIKNYINLANNVINDLLLGHYSVYIDNLIKKNNYSIISSISKKDFYLFWSFFKNEKENYIDKIINDIKMDLFLKNNDNNSKLLLQSERDSINPDFMNQSIPQLWQMEISIIKSLSKEELSKKVLIIREKFRFYEGQNVYNSYLAILPVDIADNTLKNKLSHTNYLLLLEDAINLTRLLQRRKYYTEMRYRAENAKSFEHNLIFVLLTTIITATFFSYYIDEGNKWRFVVLFPIGMVGASLGMYLKLKQEFRKLYLLEFIEANFLKMNIGSGPQSESNSLLKTFVVAILSFLLYVIFAPKIFKLYSLLPNNVNETHECINFDSLNLLSNLQCTTYDIKLMALSVILCLILGFAARFFDIFNFFNRTRIGYR